MNQCSYILIDTCFTNC